MIERTTAMYATTTSQGEWLNRHKGISKYPDVFFSYDEAFRNTKKCEKKYWMYKPTTRAVTVTLLGD